MIKCRTATAYYRTNNIKHVHIIGVNINGAIAIMNAYMGLTIKPTDPEIKEFTILQDGKIITKSYWHTTVHISNKKTETELDLPFLQDVMQKAGKGLSIMNTEARFVFPRA